MNHKQTYLCLMNFICHHLDNIGKKLFLFFQQAGYASRKTSQRLGLK